MRIILLVIIIIVVFFLPIKLTMKNNTSPKQTISNQVSQTLSPTPFNKYQRLLLWSSQVSPNNLYLATSYTGDYKDRYHYYQVFITEVSTDRMHRIYTGDYRTLGWEWTKDNKVKISYNCGTGCKSTRIIDVDEHVSLRSDRSDKWITETFKSY